MVDSDLMHESFPRSGTPMDPIDHPVHDKPEATESHKGTIHKMEQDYTNDFVGRHSPDVKEFEKYRK